MTLLGNTQVTNALGDPKFLVQFPEFAQLRVTQSALQTARKPGCARCQERRVLRTLTADFIRIIPNLNDEKKAQLKRYFGTDKLMLYVNNQQGGVDLVTL